MNVRVLIACASAALLASIHLSAGGAPQTPAPGASTSKPAPGAAAASPAAKASASQAATAPATGTPAHGGAPPDYQQMVTRYCVSCHNERAKIPAGAPLALEKASLQNPGADPDVW